MHLGFKSANPQNTSDEHKRIVKALKARLQDSQSCAGIVDGFEALLRSMWEFTTRLLGNAGARAVLSRSISLASQRAPAVQAIRINDKGVDMAEFRLKIDQLGCGTSDVMEALLELGTVIFETLSQLAGEALTEPLIKRLEED